MITTNLSSKDWDLYNKVSNCLSGYKDLLLSYSGGLDSTVLLDILTTLKKGINNLISSPLNLRAIYVHHGLSDHADTWADHCAQQCKIRNIPFDVVYINGCNHLKNKQSNIEALARKLRYQKLYNHLNSKEILLTAHHMDDQVESLFLALKRGSGPAGLSGMTKNMPYSNKYKLLRPLLYCSREQLEIYAQEKNLHWIEDNTNVDIRFDRNFLRIKILPLLYRRWPCFNRVVIRTSQLCRDQEDVLNEFLSESLKKMINTSDGSLFFKPLFQYSIPKRHALLRRWLANFSMNMPSYQLTKRIWQEVVLSRKDAMPVLQLNKYVCRRFREKLYILPENMKCSLNKTELFWDKIHNTMSLPYNLGMLTYELLDVNTHLLQNMLRSNLNINFALHSSHNISEKTVKVLTYCFIRSPRFNEKVSIIFGNVDGLLHVFGRKRGRDLKKIWQELGIPPWLRSRIPLLFYNKTLITALGVFITKNGKTNNNHGNTSWKVSWLLYDVLYYKLFRNSVNYHLE